VSKSKQKGTAAETAVVKYLEEQSFPAVRNPPQGAKDKGDIKLLNFPLLVVEVKNCVRMELSEWLKEVKAEKENAKAEVGVAWHKKRGTTNPGEWYVTMSGEDFAKLLDYWRD
jgi:Holliday junction resolvase